MAEIKLVKDASCPYNHPPTSKVITLVPLPLALILSTLLTSPAVQTSWTYLKEHMANNMLY